jgi:hypothetical protein
MRLACLDIRDTAIATVLQTAGLEESSENAPGNLYAAGCKAVSCRLRMPWAGQVAGWHAACCRLQVDLFLFHDDKGGVSRASRHQRPIRRSDRRRDPSRYHGPPFTVVSHRDFEFEARGWLTRPILPQQIGAKPSPHLVQRVDQRASAVFLDRN